MSANAAASQPAPVAAPVAQPEVSSPETQTQTAPVDDIEIELDQGLKFKKSELRERIRRQKELEKGSYERFQQAAQLRKQTEELVAQARSNPEAFLRQTGIDPEEFAKKFIQERVKYYEMTPEQRELMETRQELERARQEKENLTKQQKEAQYQQQVERYQQYFDEQIGQAMKQVRLPKTPGAVKRMAEKLEVYLSNNIPVDVSDVAREVKQEYIDEYHSTLSEWDDSELEQVYRDQAKERVRNLILKDVKSPLQQQKTNNRQASAMPRRKVNQPLGTMDLQKLYAQKFGR